MKSNFNTESHYFVPLRPLHDYGFVALTCSNDTPHLIECKLKPYTFSGFGYKLYTVPVDPVERKKFGRECYYSHDFESLVESGIIIEKTHPNMHVENVKWVEPLDGGVHLVHSQEIISYQGGKK